VTLLQHERALDFLARTFGSEALAAEHPLVFDARFAGETLELEEQGELRAACATLVREFHVGARAAARTLRGGLIGSVATAPAWRGQGLGTRLLARAEDALRARGCLFALLWADDPRFYLARGYAPFSSECDSMLVSELVRSLPEPSGVRALRADARGDDDVPFLHRLHARHAPRVERSPEEFRALLGVPGMLTLVRERAAAPGHPALPVAYACLGRGRDLADAIHDWAGEPEDVLALVGAHLRRRFPHEEAGALFLMTPPAESELGYRLLKLGAPSKIGILGLGRLLDGRSASAALGVALGDAAAVAWDGARAHVRARKGRGVELDLEALQGLLFGGP
jgi:GNAT superfamily N-acetyltransferase